MSESIKSWPSDATIRNALIIGADEARRLKGDVLFVEVRAGSDTDQQDFRNSHIPGAVYGNVKEIFAGQGSATEGSLPLPRLEILQARIGDWGVGEQTEIVVYGPQPAWAARGWWVLKWAGLTRVRLLDGGVEAWKEAGGTLEAGEEQTRSAAAKPAKLSAGNLPSIEVAAVGQVAESGTLLDARDTASYAAGPAAPGQPPAGHIPGARNLPASLAWDQKGRLRSQAELVELFSSVGVEPASDVTAYCGGGVLAAYDVLALHSVGVPAKLYVGSWSQWSSDPARGRAYGPSPA